MDFFVVNCLHGGLHILKQAVYSLCVSLVLCPQSGGLDVFGYVTSLIINAS